MPARILFVLIAAGAAIGLGAMLTDILAAGGWTAIKAAILCCYVGVAPWLGLCAGNGVLGFIILIAARDPARAVFPPVGAMRPVSTRTAIAVAVRHEDFSRVLPPLRRLLDGLDDAGAGRWFALFILSDSDADGDEPARVAAFAASDPDPARIHYRRRERRTGFKAGNLMDFLDQHAEAFPLTIVLDADSELTAAAALRLAALMQAGPTLGIVQHLTVGRRADAAFARLFQFGMRAGMRTWAVGQAAWQRDEGPYWGHNAILRSAPFRDHARLPMLRGGASILSHDQVEAARLRAAGWGIAVWAGEDGSLEENPPTLVEFIARDARWLAGNLQYRELLALPGLRPMGRWQLAQAMLLFVCPPLLAAMFALAVLNAASGGGGAAPRGELVALAAAWSLVAYGPKLLGYAHVLLSRAERRRYGGGVRFTVGALAEIVFTLLLDAPMTVAKTLALARVMLRRGPGWLPQNRAARRIGWGEALRMLWPHTAAGVAAFAALAHVSWAAAALAAPFAGGLLVSAPLAVATSSPAVSDWLRTWRIAATPEELAVPRATVSPRRRIHILYGDRTGGGHSAAAAEPGKTAFPPSWSDDQIIAAIESVANDPRARRTTQPNGRVRVEGTRGGVRIRVIVSADGADIITGYPLQPRSR